MGKGLPKTLGQQAKGDVDMIQLKRDWTVDTLPPAANHEGATVYVTDGADGSPCLAFSDGTNWIQANDPTAPVSDGGS